METLFNTVRQSKFGYRHFNSCIDDFYDDFRDYRVTSVNNHALDLERLGDVRITRFVRDPRDLVVSGYFYHKRGAEDWCNIVDPNPEDLRIVNGCIPSQMKRGESFSQHLNSVDLEEGLIAEIEFRTNHFHSMENWPLEDPRVRCFRYEDILGKEADTFLQMLSFYGISWHERQLGRFLAYYFSANKRMGRTKHIRNPVPGQWHKVFTPRVSNYFASRYDTMLRRYGYQPSASTS